jgi:hypothetical protein
MKLGVGAIFAGVLAVVVWASVNALDAQTARLESVIEAILLDREAGVTGMAFAADWERWRVLDDLALFLVAMIALGGLPMGLLAITADRVGRRPFRFACYACLAVQFVSMFLSAILVALFFPSLWDKPRPWDLFVIGYFGAQLLIGIWAVPAWRRTFASVQEMVQHSRIFRDAA